jgi:hypothetical protein
MTDIEKIYVELDESGIDVLEIRNSKIKAVSLIDDEEDRAVAVDEKLFDDYAELKTALLHEQGHCEAYAFYNEYSSYEVRQKREREADEWVAENKITAKMIETAHIKEGYTEVWEFADHFGVTVKYMKRLMYIHFNAEFMD